MRIWFALLILFTTILFMGCSEEGDVTGINLSTDWIAMTMSETRTISASAQGGGDVDIEWQSSDESVAMVSGGIITPVGPGTANITASGAEFTSDPCKVHVAEEWILYTDGSQLRVITPDDSTDLIFEGTEVNDTEIEGPMLWMDEGIVFHTLAPFNYSYLWFKDFCDDDANKVTGDTIEPIYDIRPNLEEGVFLTVYQDIHTLDPTTTYSEYVNSEHLYFSSPELKMEGLDISPDGSQFVTACRIGTSPRMILFNLDGEFSEPVDTMSITYMAVCPRFNPDGDKIAYGYATTVGRLWLIDISGGTPENVISEGQEIAGLDWSPDGSEIVMCVRNMANEYELWIGDPVSGSTRKLNSAASSNEPYFPQWVD